MPITTKVAAFPYDVGEGKCSHPSYPRWGLGKHTAPYLELRSSRKFIRGFKEEKKQDYSRTAPQEEMRTGGEASATPMVVKLPSRRLSRVDGLISRR